MSYKKYSDLPNDGTSNLKNSQNSNIIEIENLEHKNQLIQKNKVVIIDIYATWCMPCNAIAPRFASLSEEYKPYGFVFTKENVEKDITKGIRGVPNFHFYYKGNLVHTIMSADMNAIKQELEKLKQMVQHDF